jgi:SOS-response transcriptional repressor LexA
MSNFSRNFLILRKKKNLSQLELATDLGLKNSTLSNWEKGIAKPDFDVLVKVSNYFGVDLHTLMVGTIDSISNTLEVMQPTIRSIGNTLDELGQNVSVNVSPNVSVKGNKSLPKGKIKADMQVLNEDVGSMYSGKTRAIPILDMRAAAGDPYAIENSTHSTTLPTITLPFNWFRSGEHLLLQIQGDSMHPTIYNGDWVFIRKLERVEDIKDGYIYVVLSRDGIVCKRLLNRANKGHIACQSDNSTYPTYTIPLEDVISIWAVEMKMSANLRNENLEILKKVNSMDADIAELKTMIKKKS